MPHPQLNHADSYSSSTSPHSSPLSAAHSRSTSIRESPPPTLNSNAASLLKDIEMDDEEEQEEEEEREPLASQVRRTLQREETGESTAVIQVLESYIVYVYVCYLQSQNSRLRELMVMTPTLYR